MNGFRAILTKEFAHIRRDPATLVFAILVPALQLIIFGFAVNVTIDNIPLAVLDLDGRTRGRLGEDFWSRLPSPTRTVVPCPPNNPVSLAMALRYGVRGLLTRESATTELRCPSGVRWIGRCAERAFVFSC